MNYNSTYANNVIRSSLCIARRDANFARKYRTSPENMAFSRGLHIGAITTAKYIEGADRLAAMAAENEASFLLGDYLRGGKA